MSEPRLLGPHRTAASRHPARAGRHGCELPSSSSHGCKLPSSATHTLVYCCSVHSAPCSSCLSPCVSDHATPPGLRPGLCHGSWDKPQQSGWPAWPRLGSLPSSPASPPSCPAPRCPPCPRPTDVRLPASPASFLSCRRARHMLFPRALPLVMSASFSVLGALVTSQGPVRLSVLYPELPLPRAPQAARAHRCCGVSGRHPPPAKALGKLGPVSLPVLHTESST